MKNLLKIIILTIITSFIVSSCGKSMSITKRKYNKGYYVSHSHKKGGVKTQPAVATVKQPQPEQLEAIKVSPKTIAPPTIEKEAVLTAEAPKLVETKDEFVAVKKDNSTSTTYNKRFATIKKLEKFVPSKILTRELNKKMAQADRDDDDALSLLWIIILVILILYVIGLASDDFGIGGAIHILAIIALVLLILWLLRIL